MCQQGVAALPRQPQTDSRIKAREMVPPSLESHILSILAPSVVQVSDTLGSRFLLFSISTNLPGSYSVPVTDRLRTQQLEKADCHLSGKAEIN